MRRYKPKSWSHQARYKADQAYWYFWNANQGNFDDKYVNDKEWIETMKDRKTHVFGFANSYRASLIRFRAAKRFRRLVRAGKPAREPQF